MSPRTSQSHSARACASSSSAASRNAPTKHSRASDAQSSRCRSTRSAPPYAVPAHRSPGTPQPTAGQDTRPRLHLRPPSPHNRPRSSPAPRQIVQEDPWARQTQQEPVLGTPVLMATAHARAGWGNQPRRTRREPPALPQMRGSDTPGPGAVPPLLRPGRAATPRLHGASLDDQKLPKLQAPQPVPRRLRPRGGDQMTCNDWTPRVCDSCGGAINPVTGECRCSD